MGKPTGFMEYDRQNDQIVPPQQRIENFEEFHRLLPESVRRNQAARCMECGVPFCQAGVNYGSGFSGCPLHNLIPEWNDILYKGNYDYALARLLKTNNFPEFTGRVCPALCEAGCTCGLHGEPVTVRDNELAIIEHGFASGAMHPRPPAVRTGLRVAVIGSGPSGLACADTLNRRGHSVEVFERDDRPGGLLMYGIPNMKLDKSVVSRRISLMEEEGVEFHTGVDAGRDIAKDALLQQFDAVVLCCGAKRARDLKAPGRDAKGIYFAVDFLKSTTKSLLDNGLKDGGFISAKDKDVVIVGGGDTGNDCVATAIRHGCHSVVQLEMMPKPPAQRLPSNPWPEWPRVEKTDYGQAEAIYKFGSDPRIYQTTVKEFVCDESGMLSGVRTVALAPATDPATGRTAMQPVEGSEQLLPAQLLLIAAGFTGAEDYIPAAFGLPTDVRGNIATCAPYRTQEEKIFAAGDVRRGQSLVVWAICEGRGAARAVDEYLMGYSGLE